MPEDDAATETDERDANERAAVDGGVLQGDPVHHEAATDEPATDERTAPSWWHRDHPTFTSLVGFYAGLLFIIVVPGAFAAVLAALFSQSRAEQLFPLVLVTLAVPLALLLPRRTRRFARYMWVGIVSTFVVVVGVAALVLWFLVDHTG